MRHPGPPPRRRAVPPRRRKLHPLYTGQLQDGNPPTPLERRLRSGARRRRIPAAPRLEDGQEEVTSSLHRQVACIDYFRGICSAPVSGSTLGGLTAKSCVGLSQHADTHPNMQHRHATRSTQRAEAASRWICNALRTTATYERAHNDAHTRRPGGLKAACVRAAPWLHTYTPPIPGGQPVQIDQSHTNTPLTQPPTGR